jgi:hypothetical protein
LAELGLLGHPALSEGVVEGVVPDLPDPERHGPATVGDGPPVGLSADLVGGLPGGVDGAGSSGGGVRLGFPSGVTSESPCDAPGRGPTKVLGF